MVKKSKVKILAIGHFLPNVEAIVRSPEFLECLQPGKSLFLEVSEDQLVNAIINPETEKLHSKNGSVPIIEVALERGMAIVPLDTAKVLAISDQLEYKPQRKKW